MNDCYLPHVRVNISAWDATRPANTLKPNLNKIKSEV